MGTTKKFASPLGEFEWVTIDGEGKEDLQGNMKYTATVVISAEQAEAVKEELEEFWEKNRPKSIKEPKTPGWYPYMIPVLDAEGNPVIDPDTEKKVYEEDPEGRVALVFKTATTFQDSKPKKINVYDHKRRPVILGDRQIGNGSTGVLHGAMGLYTVGKKTITDAGVTLYLNSVQLSKLVEYQGGDDIQDIEGEDIPDDNLHNTDGAETPDV